MMKTEKKIKYREYDQHPTELRNDYTKKIIKDMRKIAAHILLISNTSADALRDDPKTCLEGVSEKRCEIFYNAMAILGTIINGCVRYKKCDATYEQFQQYLSTDLESEISIDQIQETSHILLFTKLKHLLPGLTRVQIRSKISEDGQLLRKRRNIYYLNNHAQNFFDTTTAYGVYLFPKKAIKKENAYSYKEKAIVILQELTKTEDKLLNIGTSKKKKIRNSTKKSCHKYRINLYNHSNAVRSVEGLLTDAVDKSYNILNAQSSQPTSTPTTHPANSIKTRWSGWAKNLETAEGIMHFNIILSGELSPIYRNCQHILGIDPKNKRRTKEELFLENVLKTLIKYKLCPYEEFAKKQKQIRTYKKLHAPPPERCSPKRILVHQNDAVQKEFASLF